MYNENNIKGVKFSKGKKPFNDTLAGTILCLNNGSYTIINQSYDIY